MTEENQEGFPMRPQEVPPDDAERILTFLNTKLTPEEIAQEIEVPDQRDVGVGVARNILARREELGGFRSLSQVAEVPQVGPQRFTDIVATLRDRAPALERERTQFRALVLANPNYFGNLKLSPFQPVLNIQSNTNYEEIGCVGFQPQFNRLESVVYIKQPSGYGGDVCSSGTPEYVRFYISYDNGAIWEDLGLTSFTAYNIPEGTAGARRLEYAAFMQISPPRRFCFFTNLAMVRAILSWNVPPPPDEPDFVPVWGDIHNTHIQIDPRRFFVIGDLLEAVDAKFPSQLSQVLDLEQQLPVVQPKALNAVELGRLYQDKRAGVEPHRYALAELQQFVSQPAQTESLMAAGSGGVLANLNLDPSQLAELLSPGDGSTRYEELECIGLNSSQDVLVGTIRVKLPNGYSGGLCSTGSKEYVTFWADFNGNGTFETCLGTTSVNVYDIDNFPSEGLEYAVFLPVDLSNRRRPCEEGATVVRVRAILSWQVPPPCPNPNYVPIWGNREETLVHIRPGPVVEPGTHTPIIQTAGSMDVDDISPATGLANGPAALAGFTANDSPFGGLVIMTGHIANTKDISQGANRLKYRVEVSGDGGATWQPLTNSFNLGRDQLLNGVWSDLPSVTQSVDEDGFYEYQEDLVGGPGNAQIFPVGNVLARWQTAGLSGIWKVRILAKDPDMVGPVWISNVVTLRVDSQTPDASISITSGGGECADFTIGDTISGNYSVSDDHFGRLTLRVLPPEINGTPSGGSFTVPSPFPGPDTMPLTRRYSAVDPSGVPTTGEAGTWALDTTGMQRCGYVIELAAWDRTIVNSGSVSRFNRDLVGLCLREPGE